MLRTVIISPDTALSEQLAAALAQTGVASVGRVINVYPPVVELMRALRAHAIELMFLNFEDFTQASELVKNLEAEGSRIQIVAIHRNMNADVIRETMRMGIREFLVSPFEERAVMDSLRHVKAAIDKSPAMYKVTDEVFAFLPSKAGVGTSTIALHVSAALSKKPNTNVMLSDFDLNSGMMRFMLKLNNTYSVADAIEHSGSIDENLWPQLVTRVGGMDVLHAGRLNPNYRIEAHQVRNLIGFMRRNYQALCFDLSGNLERYSLEIMQESKRVLLVCTPEVPSLHLAREKIMFLRDLDLASRVSVVLNRAQKKPLFTKQQVEDLLGVPVVRVFPNDYIGVNRALTEGTLVNPQSEIARGFAAFADTLIQSPTPDATPAGEAQQPASKRKFTEFFNSNRVPAPQKP